MSLIFKSLMMTGVLTLAGAAQAVTTNFWSGAAGVAADGAYKWSDAANRSEGHSPSAEEYAFFANEVAGAVIDIDVSDLSLKAVIIAAPSEAVTNVLWFTGSGFTLTEEFTGDVDFNPGAKEIPNRLVPLQVRNRSTVVFDVPVTFDATSNASGLWHGSTTGQTLTFLKPVTVTGSKDFYLHGNSTAYVDFKSAFTHPDGLLRERYYLCGNARFYGSVNVKSICKGADYNNPNWSFLNSDVQYDTIQTTHAVAFHQGAPGVFKESTVFDVSGHATTSETIGGYEHSGTYNLGNQPRTVIDRLSTDPDNAAVWENLMRDGYNYGSGITSTEKQRGTAGYGHARLTLCGTVDDKSGLAIFGAYGASAHSLHTPIDLEWDPVGDFTQTLTGRVHFTCGTLTVKRGTLKVAGNASFEYVPRISVLAGENGATFDMDVIRANSLARVRWIDLQGSGARFRIGANAVTPFGADKAIAIIDSGAKFTMPAGAAASLMAVVYNGENLMNGTYSGTGADAVDWIEGEGTITITAAEKLACWTATVSGDYDTAANWAGNAAPGANTTAVLLDKATAEPLTVTINNAITAFPSDLFVRNRGTAVTTLSIEADIAHDKGDVRIDKGGKVVVKNATYTYTGTFAEQKASVPLADQLANRRFFRVTEGGEWVTDAGGQTLIDYFIGSFLVDGSASLTGRVAAVNGGYMKYLGYTDYPLHVHPYGLLEMKDGGNVHLPHYSYNHNTTIDLHGGKINVVDAVFGGTNILGGSIVFGQGDIVFSGTSTNYYGGGVGGQAFQPVAAGEKLHVVMSGKCYGWNPDNNYYFYVGGQEGSEVTVDYGSTTPGRELISRIGTGAGKAMLNLTGTAEFKSHNIGLIVGCRDGESTAKAEGYVNLPTGTALWDRGSTSSWAADGTRLCFGSMVVGLGLGATDEPNSCRNAYGEIRVAGGTVTEYAGHSLIGVGKGEGLLMVESGTVDFKAGDCQTVVGLAGGLGHVVVSNGTVTTRKLYIGGCPKDAFTFGDNWESKSGIPFTTRHDAQGTVTVAGGTVTTGDYTTYLSQDGEGTLVMDGTAGSFTTANLVFSDVNTGTVKFLSGATGVKPVAVTGAITATDKAKLVVDVSAYTGNRMKIKLFDCGSVTGAFDVDALTVVKDGAAQRGYELMVAADGKSVYVRDNAGTLLTFR